MKDSRRTKLIRIRAGGALAITLLAGCQAGGPGQLAENPDILQKTPARQQADNQQRLTDALNLIYEDSPYGRQLRYDSTFTDLNDDGQAEAIAYVTGPNRCDNGCDLYLFRRQGDRYEAITRIPTSSAPIFLLSERHQGWHDLLVSSVSVDGHSQAQRMRYAGDSYVPIDNGDIEANDKTPLIAALADTNNSHRLNPTSQPIDPEVE